MKAHRLSESEQVIARFIAKRRYEVARNMGIYNAKKGDQSNWKTDLEGFGGELSFCRIFGTYPDLTPELFNPRMDYGDTVLANKMRVDVKTTRYKTGHLQVGWEKLDKIQVELFALMIGEFPYYEFRGFMESQTLFDPARLVNLKGSMIYQASQDELFGDI
jgi:hypothetical protein